MEDARRRWHREDVGLARLELEDSAAVGAADDFRADEMLAMVNGLRR